MVRLVWHTFTYCLPINSYALSLKKLIFCSIVQIELMYPRTKKWVKEILDLSGFPHLITSTERDSVSFHAFKNELEYGSENCTIVKAERIYHVNLNRASFQSSTANRL